MRSTGNATTAEAAMVEPQSTENSPANMCMAIGSVLVLVEVLKFRANKNSSHAWIYV